MNGIGAETKVPVYIAIIVALILIAAGGYFILESPDNPPGSSKSGYSKVDNGWAYVHDLPGGGSGIYKFEDANNVVCYYAKDGSGVHTGSLSCLVIDK